MPSPGLTSILARARHQPGGGFLLEHESLAFVEALGISTPPHALVGTGAEALELDLDLLPGDRVVVKVVAPGLAHKTELGGVCVVEKQHANIAAAVDAMARRLATHGPVGFLVAEFVAHDVALGGELLLSLRRTDDFGPVVTLGPGGTQAEFLARHLDGGRATAILSRVLAETGKLESALAEKSIFALATQSQRGGTPPADSHRLIGLIRRLLELADHGLPEEVAEIEINPLVFRDGTPIALDALVRVGDRRPSIDPPRPLARMENLLRPRSLAIMGVSTRTNPGRIVLDNVLAAGFDPARITIVKPGHETLAGCKCVPDLASLPAPVDLAVLCIGAAELPAVVEEVVARQAAQSLILIAGGLGELPGSESHGESLRATLRTARDSAWGGPLVNGGNCLGLRSLPGRYDTLFIPRHKLSYPDRPGAPLALVSQSGALAVAKASCLAELNPRYLISVGNQIDLTVSDYLVHLEDDPEVRVFAFYIEGFRVLDGARWLEATSRITRSGRAVILYRAGRTQAGSDAAATHTASIAGDYAVTRELAAAAGALVAESLEDFEDLIRLACALEARQLDGRRLGALSNAGFECVAVADGTRSLELARLAPRTVEALGGLIERHNLASVVGVANPLDVTPIFGDEAFAEALRLLLEDPNVDLGVAGCVPLTGALETLETGDGHAEDVNAERSVARRLGRLWAETRKAWVAAIDGGPRYDAMAHRLAAEGIPVVRSIDRAVRLLADYTDWRIGRRR